MEKLGVYENCPTIQDIVYIDSLRHHVEHYRRVGTQSWNMTRYIDIADSMKLEGVDATLTVQDVYFKVYLEEV